MDNSISQRFSILIANFNNGKYFNDCYNSIISQGYSNWEVIIVDDCSTDDSVSIISNLIKGDSRFAIFQNKANRGCGYTKGKCLEYAIGEICAFLDPDDTIFPYALDSMIHAHLDNPGVGLVHSNLVLCDANLKERTVNTLAKKVIVSSKFTNLDYAVTAFASFKKAFYLRTPGLDTKLKRAVDQDLYLKLSEKGPFYFLDKVLYKYRIHKMGIASNYVNEAMYSHLKAIASAEERRMIDLENEVAPFLTNADLFEQEIRLNNPGFLWLKLSTLFKKDPASFFKKMLRKGKN